MLRSTAPVYIKGGSSRCNRRVGVGLRANRTPLLAAAAAMAALLTTAAVVAASVMTLASFGLGQTSPSDQQLQQNSSAAPAESNTTAAGEPEWQQSNVTHLVAMATVAADDAVRFRPSSFPPDSKVLNQTVHCDKPSDRDLDIFYTAPTWMCKNIRVGEHRLPFCDVTLRTSNDLVLHRRKDLEGDKLFRGMCGHLPDRRNNEFVLCELLLDQLAAGHLTAPPVASSVHVPRGNCSLPERRRIIMVGSAESSFNWHIESRLRPGFVTDLFCSFAVQR